MIYKLEKIEIVESKLFVGSKDGGVEERLKRPVRDYLWVKLGGINAIESRAKDSLRVFKDVLTEYPEQYEANKFQFKVGQSDSLFRWNIYANFWQYYGRFPSDRQHIYYERNFSTLHKKRPNISFDLSDDSEGYASKDDFFWGNEYHFPTIKHMTEKTDTVMYCNVRYVYKKVKN
ncbi:hypothetical protein GQF61_11695 [Sphingobacterium sp. DK4209]|uniref:Uncharacterized protein n=1 Tax=Sphingobacterium zhuxiongii TaxID=2662364 RepID=A0A5Q0QIM1_9SPHI|nr:MULTISPECIES: hypothetical protein [unclassified Sphingobacterium]MVZ66524.1 hypothetical protein [Sphingobacterium sp. DK4209]QGA27822.1 hypothetical protein GFH32_16495 [Sphingobacterium sp. dk4302]